jgi:hypothetical protein
MKMKLIIVAVVMMVSVYSCSNDRDNEARKAAIEKVKNSQKENVYLRKTDSGKATDQKLNNKIVPPGDIKLQKETNKM